MGIVGEGSVAAAAIDERMPRRPEIAREALGWAFAVAMAVLVTAHVAITRDELVFVDADSMFNALVVHSLTSGAPQDWALSPVLFVPEVAAFALVSAVTPDLHAVFVVSSMLNFVALYGAFRVASGSRSTATAPVLGAVAGYAGFCTIALLESGGDRDSMQLASLLGTTTYYGATVIAAVVVIGLVRRVLDAGRLRARLLVPLGAVAAVSAFSNPLVVVWAVAPIALVLVAQAIVHPERMSRRPRGLLHAPPAQALLVLAAASVIGIVARSMLGDLVVARSSEYLKDGNQFVALGDLLRVATVELMRPGGVIGGLVLLGLTALAVVLTFSRTASERPGPGLLVAVAWIAPVACTVGVVLLGNPSPRYLQPWVFAPMLVLACLAEWAPPGIAQRLRGGGAPRTRRGSATALAAASVVMLVLGGVGAARLATTPTPARAAADSLACVVDWVDATDRHGAGQFWTVRAPKAYAADPATLLQVTHDLHPYEWLVNRTDFDTTAVSYLVTDSQSAEFVLPEGVSLDDATTVDCGRYTIHDFGSTTIPVG
ncbi:hypothetical protein [Agromyces sp. NPDC058110]|uniref:hypothetical protein n=1 Tax=Agromyces sp. NPDC058110 TaxID=3346345 RepID=UPI0036DD5A17